MFKGKAINNPSGKAQEYSYWACNFYVGCSNECTYCYLKKGIGAKTLGGNVPKLKACFKNEYHAIEIFEKELLKNKVELQKHGLFFSFTTDPAIRETFRLTFRAVNICMENDIPVKILTKRKLNSLHLLNWVDLKYHDKFKKLMAIGFTLTGHDELEPNACSNLERVDSILRLSWCGFKTFASIEPIIDIESSKRMIELSKDFCNLYKIGLESGKKYNKSEAIEFVKWLDTLKKPKIYLKKSLQKLTGYTNSMLDEYFVERDYNLHS